MTLMGRLPRYLSLGCCGERRIDRALCVLRCSWARGTSELGLLDANGRGVGSFAMRERDYVASDTTSDETASQRVPLTAYGPHQRVYDQCVQRGTTRQLLLEAAFGSAIFACPLVGILGMIVGRLRSTEAGSTRETSMDLRPDLSQV